MLLLALSPPPINGIVINQTTGKPQPRHRDALPNWAAAGMRIVESAKPAPDGKFAINQILSRPARCSAPPSTASPTTTCPAAGSPTTDLTVDVYNLPSSPAHAKVSKHMILFEPGGGQMAVNETFLYRTTARPTWNDPDNGTLHFFLPPEPPAS